MVGCFVGNRTRRYIDHQQRIEAKMFNPVISDTDTRFQLRCSDKFPQIFSVTKHEDFAAVLRFEIQDADSFPVPLRWDNTRYPRLIFICPCCCEKRLYLYGASNGWACRKCLKLSYGVQSMGTEDRLRKRIRKLRRSIWGEDVSLDTFERSYPFSKPKRKRIDNFYDEVEKLNQIEDRYLKLVEQRFIRLDKVINALAGKVNLI